MPEISNILVWLILGGISGWLGSKITGNDARMGIGWNLIVGIIGAFIGGWLAGRCLWAGSCNRTKSLELSYLDRRISNIVIPSELVSK